MPLDEENVREHSRRRAAAPCPASPSGAAALLLARVRLLRRRTPRRRPAAARRLRRCRRRSSSRRSRWRPPALKGLSEGVKGYAGSKGWEVIVQDPNFDPTKQAQQLNEVLDSGRAGAAWVIAVAPESMGDVLKTAQSKGIPILVNGKPDEYGFDGPQPGITFDYIDYAAGGTGARRPARQVHHREARRQRARCCLRRVRRGHGRQGGVRRRRPWPR